MTSAQSPAIDQALAALRAPGLYSRVRERRLPEDVLVLLKVAAGEAQTRELACASTGAHADTVIEAAVLFIQQAMFYPGSDSYRLLGVSAAATDSQIKEHYRWLVRWLHPDRNTEQWDAVYADRVNRAWQDLRTPERRKDYEAHSLPSSHFAGSWPEAGALVDRRPVGNWPAGEEFLLSARTARRLPLMIMGGLVLASVAMLGLQYQLTKKAARAEAVELAKSDRPAVAPLPINPWLETVPQRQTAALESLPPPSPQPIPQTTPQPAPPPSTPVKPATPPAMAVLPRSDRIAESTAKIAIAYVRPAVALSPPRVAAGTQPRQTEVIRPDVPRMQASVPAVAKPAPAALAAPDHRSLINSAVASEVIMRFRSAYSSGNINQFRDLLASGPVSDPRERSAILRSYAKLFETSERRRIEIHGADWLTDGDTAVLIASYDAWIVPRGDDRERHFFGNIRFDLRSEDGELRVARLRHDSVGG